MSPFTRDKERNNNIFCCRYTGVGLLKVDTKQIVVVYAVVYAYSPRKIEPPHDKTNKMSAQRRLISASASALSDESLRCALNG